MCALRDCVPIHSLVPRLSCPCTTDVHSQALMPTYESLGMKLTQSHTNLVSLPYLITICRKKQLWWQLLVAHYSYVPRFLLAFVGFVQYTTKLSHKTIIFSKICTECLVHCKGFLGAKCCQVHVWWNFILSNTCTWTELHLGGTASTKREVHEGSDFKHAPDLMVRP